MRIEPKIMTWILLTKKMKSSNRPKNVTHTPCENVVTTPWGSRHFMHSVGTGNAPNYFLQYEANLNNE